MAKESPAFQFYPQDFLVGTADMSCEEVGAYIRLLSYQWTKGGLPDDDDKLCRLAGCDGNAIASIRHKFRSTSAGVLHNERLEQVRQAQAEYRKQQADNARNGWKKRVGNATAMRRHSDGNADPDAKPYANSMPNGCSSSSSSSSSSNRQTDKAAPNFPAFDLFDRLCKRKLTTSEQGRIHTWLDSLGDHDAGLVCQCVQHAVENIASTPQTVRGAINYVAAIYERCLREGCGPGDFPAEERKPSGRESELESKRKLARKLAVEAYANEPA